MEILDISSESASISCFWPDGGATNLTWLLDGDMVDQDLVEETSNSSVLSFSWEELDVKEGEVVEVTCYGEEEGLEVGTSWMVTVPGDDEENEEVGSGGVEEAVEDNEVDTDTM